MNENEKQVFYLIESMRDGCTRDIIYEKFTKEEADSMLSNFLERQCIFESSGLLSINYEKIKINCWIDVEIK